MDRDRIGQLSSSDAPFPLTAACALFLDIDGTLLELAPSPSAVAVDPQITALLPALSRALGGACALVTGRSVTDVDALFPGLRLPISGQHGCEQRDVDGTIHLYAKNRAMLDRLRTLFASFAAKGLQSSTFLTECVKCSRSATGLRCCETARTWRHFDRPKRRWTNWCGSWWDAKWIPPIAVASVTVQARAYWK